MRWSRLAVVSGTRSTVARLVLTPALVVASLGGVVEVEGGSGGGGQGARGHDSSAVAAVSLQPAGEQTPGVEYGWPLVPPPPVARRFEEPPFRYGRGHRGADLAGLPGQAVVAARAGQVVFVGAVAGRGVVSVLHADGLRTTYEPVTATVARGVRVARGDPIGVLDAGHPGCPTPACLHWGVRRGSGSSSDYLDPLVLVRPRFVRLYPVP